MLVDGSSYLIFFSTKSDHLALYDLSYLYFGLVGVLMSMVIGLIVSLIVNRCTGNVATISYLIYNTFTITFTCAIIRLLSLKAFIKEASLF